MSAIATLAQLLEQLEPSVREAVERHLRPACANSLRMERRDNLIRHSVDRFYDGLTRRAAAHALARDLARVATRGHGHGELESALRDILAADGGRALSARQIETVLAGARKR